MEAQTLAAPVRIPPPATPWGMAPGQHDVWPSPAQEQLLRATLIPDERALEAWRSIRAQIDVPSLDGATTALLPMLRKNLLALGEEDELLTLFKGVHRYSWARNQMLLAPMIAVVQALERVGAPTLLLKGAAFVADRRLDAGMRLMNDIDVLVPFAQRHAAIEVLLDAGLEPVGEVPPWYVADYAPNFVPSHGFRDELDRQLDLHWHVLHASCQPDADEDFWAAAMPIELLGVATRALCPADELLLVILHGLRWNAIPTYRWVVDAALLCSGALGEVDYDRLVEQARKRRVTVSLRAGLEYLRETVAASIPLECVRALRSPRGALLERLEFRAQLTQPRARSTIQHQVVYHQQHVRREIPLRDRPTLARHIALARRRLGIGHVSDLRQGLAGGVPGPGRPSSEVAAAIGSGAGATSAAPVAVGEPVDLGQPELARDYTVYGTWLAEGVGCWIAGRQARLALPLSEPASSSLVLEISADGFLAAGCTRQRLEVSVNGSSVAALAIDAEANLREEPVVLPRALLDGHEQLDVVLATPDATSAVELGVDDDDRSVGVFLRGLTLRAPRTYTLGETLLLSEADGSSGGRMLVGGWGAAEPTGRWTLGARARLLLRLQAGEWPQELECDATPFLGRAGRVLRVELLVNGSSAGTLDYDRASDEPLVRRIPIPAAGVDPAGEIVLEWRIHDPRSPHDLGVSSDRRPLGLFVRRLALLGAAD